MRNYIKRADQISSKNKYKLSIEANKNEKKKQTENCWQIATNKLDQQFLTKHLISRARDPHGTYDDKNSHAKK